MSAHDALDLYHSGLLSDATILALQLHHQPFSSQLRNAAALPDDNADATAEPFSDDITEEQLADIKQALITGDDLLLILGEQGAGKTTLVQQLNTNSGLRIQCFSATGSERFSTLNLFAGMLDAFQREPPQKLKDTLDELIPCLQSMAARNTLCVVVLDDAHKVDHAELTQLLSGMLYMNSQDETLMRIAFAAAEDFEALIPDLLPEGADLPYSSLTIEGFSPTRAAAYLDYRLGLAGFDQEFPFTERDMASLVDHSNGRPAELHALTADVLNEKYGRLEETLPRELISDHNEGIFSSRKGKFALGVAATVLIIGGMLMFLPQGDVQDRGPSDEPIDVAEQEVMSTPDNQDPTVSNNNTSIADITTLTQPEVSTDNPVETTLQNLGSEETESVPATESTSAISATAEDDQTTDTQNLATSSDVEENTLTVAPTSEESSSAEAISANSTEPAADSVEETTSEELSQTIVDESAATSDNSVDADRAATDKLIRESVGGIVAPDTDESSTQTVVAEVQEATETEITEAQSATEEAIEEADEAADEAPDEAPDEESADPSPGASELADLLESPNWILVQDENQYTIQMSASRDLESVQNFLLRNPLPRPNSIFSFEREGDIWYALVHGIYSTFPDAQLAVENMSASAQRDQPWIRSVARVKEILRQE